MQTTKDIVQKVRNCGISLIENAESIAGDYKYQHDLRITIDIPVTDKEPPDISVDTSFYPEGSLKEYY